jgi:hypothetical protein
VDALIAAAPRRCCFRRYFHQDLACAADVTYLRIAPLPLLLPPPPVELRHCHHLDDVTSYLRPDVTSYLRPDVTYLRPDVTYLRPDAEEERAAQARGARGRALAGAAAARRLRAAAGCVAAVHPSGVPRRGALHVAVGARAFSSSSSCCCCCCGLLSLCWCCCCRSSRARASCVPWRRSLRRGATGRHRRRHRRPPAE